jgi:hypothetical protein
MFVGSVRDERWRQVMTTAATSQAHELTKTYSCRGAISCARNILKIEVMKKRRWSGTGAFVPSTPRPHPIAMAVNETSDAPPLPRRLRNARHRLARDEIDGVRRLRHGAGPPLAIAIRPERNDGRKQPDKKNCYRPGSARRISAFCAVSPMRAAAKPR